MRSVGLALAVAVLGSPAAAEDWQPRLKRGGWEIGLNGYVQYDARDYPNWDLEDETLRNDTSEFPRRLRVGIDGEWKRLSFELQFDPNDSSEHLKDAWVELKVSKALRIRGGNTKVPVGREWLTSAARTDFVERSMLTNSLAPGRDWGGLVSGEVLDDLEYAAGLFTGDGRGLFGRSETTGALRLVYKPWKGLEVGASYSRADVEADTDLVGGDPRAKGFAADAASGFRYYLRHFVQGTRERMGGDVALERGPFSVKGEYLRGREERLGQGSTCRTSGVELVCDDLPTLVGEGWSASATWLLTGEKKKRTIEPKRPFPSGPGALELAVRWETLDHDDDGPGTGFAGSGTRARNVRPAGVRTLTGGLSWWPRAYVRLMANVILDTYDDALLAPERNRSGNYVTLVGRIQVVVP